jgi:hypothetical protein
MLLLSRNKLELLTIGDENYLIYTVGRSFNLDYYVLIVYRLTLFMNREFVRQIGQVEPDPGDVRPEPENPEPSPGDESEIEEEYSIMLRDSYPTLLPGI